MSALAVLAPVASADIGVPASAVGLMTSIIYLSGAIAAPQAGARVAQFGALRLSQIGLVLVALGMAVATVTHPLMALLAAVVIGLGYGPSTPSGSALLAARTPPRVFNFVMSIRQTGVPLGGALAGFAIPWLILAAGWRKAALICAVACVLAAAALQTVRARFDHPAAGTAATRTSFVGALSMVLAHRAL